MGISTGVAETHLGGKRQVTHRLEKEGTVDGVIVFFLPDGRHFGLRLFYMKEEQLVRAALLKVRLVRGGFSFSSQLLRRHGECQLRYLL